MGVNLLDVYIYTHTPYYVNVGENMHGWMDGFLRSVEFGFHLLFLIRQLRTGRFQHMK